MSFYLFAPKIDEVTENSEWWWSWSFSASSVSFFPAADSKPFGTICRRESLPMNGTSAPWVQCE